MLYSYKAYVTEVYDGDTITVNIDLGMHTFINGLKLRLAGINAPEVRGEEREQGLKARDWLRKNILLKEVIIRTNKDKTGKYGRYIGYVYLDGKSINNMLVSQGYATYKEY